MQRDGPIENPGAPELLFGINMENVPGSSGSGISEKAGSLKLPCSQRSNKSLFLSACRL